MRGTIVKRNGNYSIVLSMGKDQKTKKYKQQWIAVDGDKRAAETKLAEILRQKDVGTFIKPGKITAGEFLERWLRDYVKPNLAPRTSEGYESIVRMHLIPSLGKTLLTQLRPETIQRYYSDKLKGNCLNRNRPVTSSTIRHHHMVLHGALKMAVRWGLLSRNVADAVDPPRKQSPEMHTMNEEEIQLFLEAAKKTPYYALFYTALFTGMRRSELLALRWSDCCLALCQVSVTRALHQLRDKSIIIRQTKTEKSRRLIALPPSAALVLKEYKDKQIAQRIILGTTLKEDDLIFCHEDATPMIPDLVSQGWTRLIDKVGLKDISLHDARHTHASLMLKQGIHPKIVQERLGHSSITVTLDTYSHVAPGLQEAAAALFDKGLSPLVNKDTIANKA